jgi:hypothetical protein
MHQLKHSGKKTRPEFVSGDPDANREMLRFIQRRKFRLVTQWKARLKENISFQLPDSPEFPYRLVFRAFDEVLSLLKLSLSGATNESAESLLDGKTPEQVPTADQFMEMFLTGRDVLEEFVNSDGTFCATFAEPARARLRGTVEQVLKDLVEREMGEYSRKWAGGWRTDNRIPLEDR